MFSKNLFKKFFKDSFQRDVVALVLASILIGSLLATAVSLAANSYFSKTLANLVGDYGQYDIIIQVREEMKEDAATQINKIINDVFPGSSLKEGPTITGKTTFFVALPDQYKTQQVYDDLGKTFGSIPGGAGVGVVTEPRLTIRGVPEGAKGMVIDNIMKMDGVRFAFYDGASIGVVMTALDKAPAVNDKINAMLKNYQVIEISFPVGSEPSNPIRLGDAIADDMQNQLKLQYAKNVSVDGKNNDMTYMVSTMMELRRFLQAYASQVTITPDGNVKLNKGDTLVFQGGAAATPAAGDPPDKTNVLVQITGFEANGVADGTIMQGDASQLTNNQAYKLDNGVVGSAAGTATYRNPRQELGNALTETTKVVGQIPGFSQDAQKMSNTALGVLNNYSSSIAAMQQTLGAVQDAGTTIQAATSGLANIDTSGLQTQLDNSSRAIGGLINTMQVVKLIQNDAGSTVDSLTATQHNLNNLKSGLSAIDNISTEARQAKNAIDNIVNNGQSTLATLQAFDVNGARNSLQDANNRLAALQQINTPLVTAQIQYLAAAVPNLKDEDISHSVTILDKFIGGQVIPGERIQILTTSNISTDAVAPVVYNQVGHKDVSLYSTSLGVIEPNPRAELMKVLTEVKGVLSGMVSIVATILFMVLDHTAIMSVIRRKRMANKVKAAGWRKVAGKLAAPFIAPEKRYGMAVSAVMLTAMFMIAGGGIPYLPWVGVPVLGALLGLLVASYAEKISPIAGDEVMAGEALGLSLDEIMREIVIPSGRPGLMQKLNQRKLKFK